MLVLLLHASLAIVLMSCIQTVANAQSNNDDPHLFNLAVVSGAGFKFECIATVANRSRFQWRFLSPASLDRSPVPIDSEEEGASSNPLSTKYSVVLSSSSRLEVSAKVADASYAGTYWSYMCRNSTQGWGRAADLTVLESNPICNVEGSIESKLLQCTVNFSGYYYPRMEWYSSNGTLMRTCDEQSVNYTDGLLSLRCDVNVSMSEGGGAQCRTFFTTEGLRRSTPRLGIIYSAHVPSYTHACLATFGSRGGGALSDSGAGVDIHRGSETEGVPLESKAGPDTPVISSIGLYVLIGLGALTVGSMLVIVVVVSAVKLCKRRRKHPTSKKLGVTGREYDTLSKASLQQQPESVYDSLSSPHEEPDDHVTYLEIIDESDDKRAGTRAGVDPESENNDVMTGKACGQYEEVLFDNANAPSLAR